MLPSLNQTAVANEVELRHRQDVVIDIQFLVLAVYEDHVNLGLRSQALLWLILFIQGILIIFVVHFLNCITTRLVFLNEFCCYFAVGHCSVILTLNFLIFLL